jgi:spermidine synthase
MAPLATAFPPVTARPRTRVVGGAVVGLLGGAAAGMESVVATGWLPAPGALVAVLVGSALVGAVGLALLDVASRPLVDAAGPESARALRVLLPASRLPALLPFLGAAGVHVPLALTVLLLLLARAGAVVLAMPRSRRGDLFSSLGWLSFLFLVSGFAALIYQITWQRALFTAFGVNIESITVVVSLFMLGLGLGSLAGGLLSRRWPDKAPLLFFACEAGIGLFGVVSLPLIEAVSRATLHGSLSEVSLAVFALLGVPTVLMGATLPILVTHLDRRLKSVGQSVGLLYCINTVGSALACFLTADVLFVVLGRQASVLVAASLNLLVGVLVLRFARAARARPAAAARDEAPASAPPPGGPEAGTASPPLALVLLLAAAAGWVSLSQEIVWMRVVGTMTGGSPTVFAHVLGVFLAGVALGSFRAERLCRRLASEGRSLLGHVARSLLAAGAFWWLSIAATAFVHDANPPLGVLLAHVTVGVVAYLLGGVLPVLCHAGARSGPGVGVAVSRLYAANIAGCTLGPLLTGFVLLERWSTAEIVLGLGVGTLVLAAVAALGERRRGIAVAVAALLAAGALPLGQGALYGGFLERLHMDRGREIRPYRVVIENRHGTVATARARAGGPDVVYGGSVYDGTMNTDPRDDSNRIDRCYLVAALHPRPKEALEVGMSGGSWTRVLADYGAIERLTVVEINPGYLDLLLARDERGLLLYPRNASVLGDPKVDVQVDDGRRWLNRHPERRFDLVVQNTPHHWRSQVTNLLSEEYLRLVKSRLTEGGVYYANSTGSYDVPFTAARVFRHVAVVRNFVAASDAPFDLPPERVRENLLRFRVDGRPTFDPDRSEDAALLVRLPHLVSPDRAEDFRARRDVLPDFPAPAVVHSITDDDMATEYKRAPLLAGGRAWGDHLARLREAWSSGGS